MRIIRISVRAPGWCGVPRRPERFTLPARAEAFNILNHTNFVGAFAPSGRPTGASFGTASVNLSASNFGQVTGAYDPRILQFAMKLIF